MKASVSDRIEQADNGRPGEESEAVATQVIVQESTDSEVSQWNKRQETRLPL